MFTKYKNIFDSHSHYDAEQFDSDRDELLAELPNRGVAAIMSAADSIESAVNAEKIANKYPYIYFAAGVHPHEASTAKDNLENQIKDFAKNPKMRAVGEIGLDYYYDHSPRDVQREVFIRQLQVADELDLPVIIHNREATGDTMDILREFKPKKAILHSFSSSVEIAEELLDMGFYIGFAGVITFKNAKRPVEVVKEIPVDRLLLETDAPYLAPVPMRGKRSDSSMIAYTAEKMAEIKGMDTQELIDIIFENTCNVFEINSSDILKNNI